MLQGSGVSGTAVNERILDKTGSDTLTGGGGSYAVFGGAGNDTLLVTDAQFQRADGGLGVDTFKFDTNASGITWDFTSP